MEDVVTALRNLPRPGWSRGASERARRRSMEPQHRRRRALALLAIAGVVVIAVVGISALSGGHGAARHHAKTAPGGYLGRIRTLAGGGAGSLAALELAGEKAAVARTLKYTPYVRIAGAQHREIALTFDDGPGPYTPSILSILGRQDVPATFFEVGVLEHYFHASTSEIVKHGWVIGDHTETHAPMSKLTEAEQQAQILEQTGVISQYGAPFPRLFRPPYGLWNAKTLALLRQYQMLMVLWTVDTNDYRRPGVRAIVHAAVSGARPGAIILLHDAGGDRSQTVAALPKIIKALRARGYRLVTVPRLLLDNPAPANQRVAYLIGAGG